MRTFTIELRVDFDDKNKEDIMKDATIQAARGLFTTARLIADKRQPQIAVHSSDFFASNEELDLLEGIDL